MALNGGMIATMIKNVTGYEIKFRDCFMGSTTEMWYMDAVYRGESYRVIKFDSYGVISMYKQHPVDQKVPTSQIKLYASQ